MKFGDFVAGTAFLMILGTCCAGVFWFVLHTKEVQSTERYVAFASMKGTPAPAFVVRTISGQSVSSRERERPLVLEIFATWCEICTAEIPTLNRLRVVHPDIDVVAITGSNIGSDSTPESLSDVRRYQLARGVHYPLVFDASRSVVRDYRVVAFPSIYVIDRKGSVTFNQAGAVAFGDLDRAVQEASTE